jgi:hypothetical protein
LIDEAFPFPLKLDGTEAGQRTVNMKKIITIDDEMHLLLVA